MIEMKARSFSHVGITVKDFNEFVRFYWDVFGCPLVGVSDTPSDRVRAFFGVDPSTSLGAGAPAQLQDWLDPLSPAAPSSRSSSSSRNSRWCRGRGIASG